MNPIRTRATTTELKPPPNWDGYAGTCRPLHVALESGLIYSYWKPTLRERVMILFGRPVRLAVAGPRMPPVALEASPALEAKP